ncbi:unnamed protein product [Rotaria sp. Silwood2]|nr:unnamed protein product [Rotaria sp. Silwood2]CAF4271484.1 unnamed protein product [Rotaria sp. Silwood2]
MSVPVVYSPPVIPIYLRIRHRFPKSAIPPPPSPANLSNETSANEPLKQTSIKHDANTRGLLLGDLSFLSRPPPNISVPPPNVGVPHPSKVDVTSVKPTTIPTPSLECDIEKERSSHITPIPTNAARTQFLDAIKDRFTSSSDCVQMTERQSLEVALESDLKTAVSMNLYGNLTRSISDWKTNPLLCKRMNIPNPYPDDAYDDSKESKKSRRQLYQERPPLDLFSAIFDNQHSDDENADEQEVEEKKNDDIPIPINLPSSIVSNPTITKPLASSSSITYQSDHADSSDSSIEEIGVSDKSSLVYEPAVPSNLPSCSKTEHDKSIWTKLANTSAQYEELKHKKKKKHHKKV